MIHNKTALSNLLAQYMGRIYTRTRSVNTNQAYLKHQENEAPEKAAKFTLGENRPQDSSVTYRPEYRKNLAEIEAKEPPMPVEIKAPPKEAEAEPVEAKAEPEKNPSQALPDFTQLNQSLFKEFQSAWDSEKGSDSYNASFDYDSNGVIDMVDYVQFGKEYKSAVDGFKQAWGTSSKDAKFSSQYDYDRNGVIDMKDYTQFGKTWLA